MSTINETNSILKTYPQVAEKLKSLGYDQIVAREGDDYTYTINWMYIRTSDGNALWVLLSVTPDNVITRIQYTDQNWILGAGKAVQELQEIHTLPKASEAREWLNNNPPPREILTIAAGINCGRTLTGLAKVVDRMSNPGDQLILNDEDTPVSIYQRMLDLGATQLQTQSTIAIHPDRIDQQWVDQIKKGVFTHILIDCTGPNSKKMQNVLFGAEYQGDLTITVQTTARPKSIKMRQRTEGMTKEQQVISAANASMFANINSMYGAQSSTDMPEPMSTDAFADLLASRVADRIAHKTNVLSTPSANDDHFAPRAVNFQKVDKYIVRNSVDCNLAGPFEQLGEAKAQAERIGADREDILTIVRCNGEDEFVYLTYYDCNADQWRNIE